MIALCLGGAPSVWSEFESAKALIGDRAHVVVAANHAGVEFPGHLDAWASLHPERMDGWREQRRAKGLNDDFRALVYPRRHLPRWMEPWPYRWKGSSGLFMAQAALEALGCRGAILCGVPMDAEAGHITGAATWPFTEKYRPAFLEAKAEGAPIRSMGGWTAEVLGRPDADWIKSLRLARSKPRKKPKEPAMRVKFKRDRNWTPPEERRITVAYKAGWEGTIKRAWGEQMRDDGDLDEVASPARDPLDHDGNGRKGGAKKAADA